MSHAVSRGEVWLVDLGWTANVRPCLILSVPPADEDRALDCIVPHTTSVRRTRFEVPTAVPFLKEGAFDAQNLVTIPTAKLFKRLGTLSSAQITIVEDVVRRWLGL